MLPTLFLYLLLLLLTLPAQAAISPESAARLQTELTPLGATRAGNRNKTIPKWEGGLRPSSVEMQPVPIQPYPDPFANDKPVYTVTSKNWQRYREVLSAGQQALLQQYPTYQLVVYPTQRSAAFPDEFYQVTQQLATTAELTPTGDLTVPRFDGIPFPLPRSGEEALWNYQLRHQGQWLTRRLFQAIPTAQQPYLTVTWQEQWRFTTMLQPSTAETLWQYRQYLQSPDFLAGQHRWLQAPRALNQPVAAWLQLPSDSRARRLPTFHSEQALPFSDGLQTLTQWPALTLTGEHYEFALKGRQELLTPYNAYALSAVDTETLLAAQHINQTLPRYELHRLWVVVATRKEAAKTALYQKQVFYFDEDSWHLLAVELYDKAGALSRVIEHHPVVFYDVPTMGTVLTVVYDLTKQRYLVQGLAAEPFLCDFHTPIAEQAMQPTQ